MQNSNLFKVTKLKPLLAFTALSLALGAGTYSCGKKKDDEKKGGGASVSLKFTGSQLALKSSLAAETRLGLTSGDANLSSAPVSKNGYNKVGDLSVISYYVSRIGMGEKWESSGGTGGNISGQTVSIYQDKATDAPDYNTFLPANAETRSAGFINFLDKDALKAVVSEAQILKGEYQAVSTNWQRPFKIKGSIKLGDNTVYTKKATEYVGNGKSGLEVQFWSKIMNSLAGEAQEQVMFFPNGGTNFKLSKPFVVSEDDVKNKVKFVLNMVFDPEGLFAVTKRENAPTNFFSGSYDTDNKVSINSAMMDIVPVIYRENETLMRETYLLSTQPGASYPHTARVSFYYVKEDTTKSVKAVSLRTFSSPTSDYVPQNFGKADSVAENSDGTVSVKDWSGANILKDFKRVANSTTKNSVTHEYCAPEHFSGTTCSALSTQIYEYTLVGIEEIEKGTAVVAVTPVPTPTPVAP